MKDITTADVVVELKAALQLDDALAARVEADRREWETWQDVVARLVAEVLYPPYAQPPSPIDTIVTVTSPHGPTLDVAVRCPDGARDIQAAVDADTRTAAYFWAAGLRSRQPDAYGYVDVPADGWDLRVGRNAGPPVQVDADYYDEWFPELGVYGTYVWRESDLPPGHPYRKHQVSRARGWGEGWYQLPPV